MCYKPAWLTLKALSKFLADNILNFYYFSEKIRHDNLCELSAGQTSQPSRGFMYIFPEKYKQKNLMIIILPLYYFVCETMREHCTYADLCLHNGLLTSHVLFFQFIFSLLNYMAMFLEMHIHQNFLRPHTAFWKKNNLLSLLSTKLVCKDFDQCVSQLLN